jgi:hypothetical protein
MEVPQFIFELFEKELRSIQIDLLKKVATKNGLNVDELIKDFLPEHLKLVSNTKTRIQVQKKNEPPSPPKPEERCMARVWNRGKGGQCIRRRMSNENDNKNEKCDYCSQHEKNRKHGRIDQPPSKEVFSQKSSVVYK